MAVLLLRDTEAEVVECRCPTSIVLGLYSDSPFAPWPSYEEGASATLADELRALNNGATTVE